MQINMPTDVKKILSKLNKWGYEGYIVGGCVRDCLMGLEPSDWDIAMSATPNQAKTIFRKTIDTGIAHGTITVVLNNENYELTTYRTDGEYLDNRRPSSVIFSDDLTEDLSRRDFTVNAIAYSDKDGIVDCFDGLTDIKNKILRCVGNPNERFREDALRMLRALRFAAQLGFDIEQETYDAIVNNASLIKNISMERIRDEIRKIIMSGRPECINLLAHSGLSAYIDNTLNDYLLLTETNAINALRYTDKYLPVRLALLFVNMDISVLEKLLKYMLFENIIIKTTLILSRWINTNIENDYYSIRKAVRHTGIENFLYILEIKKIIDQKNIQIYNEMASKLQNIVQNGDCISLKDLKIDGNDLKDLGIKDGREIGNMLEFLLDDVLKDPGLNTGEALKKTAMRYI